MTDDLIKRLRDMARTGVYTDHNDFYKAADRIEELEKARDMWMERVDVVEAELAAARACIRWFSSGNHPWDADHRSTIAAAREARDLPKKYWPIKEEK